MNPELEEHWSKAADAITWHQPWTKVVEEISPRRYRWFVGGEMNSCYNAVDRHVEAGNGDRTALIFVSAMTGTRQTFSYSELRDHVAKVAGAMKALGVGKGDRVLIYMPMVPEAVFAVLACARLGAIHSVVFGGFAAPELAKRIDDAKPKAVMSASCGLEPGRVVAYKPILDEALAHAHHKIPHCLILQRPQCEAKLVPGRDHDWNEAVARAEPAPCVPVAATDPLYVLYTSGTTGVPKGILRDNGGHAVALSWSMKNVYSIDPGETFWAASDIGWVVGHSYIIYGPLIHGATSLLFEGKPVGTPDAGTYWRIVKENNVRVLFTAPTAIRAIKREDPQGELLKTIGTANMRALFLAGERADPDTVRWAQRILDMPVIDHWWQTELGWPAIATCFGMGHTHIKPGSAGKAVPGFQFTVFDEARKEVGAGITGDLAIKLPLPPGSMPTLWNNDAGFEKSYLTDHPGYYATGDAAYIDDDGFIHVMGRTDDIINVAGHRLSTGAMEQVVAAHPDVAECAVIGAADALKGQVPVALIVLKASVNRPTQEIVSEVIHAVRDTIGPVAAFRLAAVVPALPKTRSGKILRATIRKMADGETAPIPATIEDPKVLDHILDTLKDLGLTKKIEGFDED